MQLKKLKAMIDYLAENHPELLEEYIAVAHDMIFLPSPKDQTDTTLLLEINENDFYLFDKGRLRGFC